MKRSLLLICLIVFCCGLLYSQEDIPAFETPIRTYRTYNLNDYSSFKATPVEGKASVDISRGFIQIWYDGRYTSLTFSPVHDFIGGDGDDDHVEFNFKNFKNEKISVTIESHYVVISKQVGSRMYVWNSN